MGEGLTYGMNGWCKSDDDSISRAAAIDEIKALYEWHDIVTEDRAIEHFKKLTSAQPEIIRCKDCLMHGVCRFEQGLGLDGYCSQAQRREE